jgi:PAS domain S-box-containing protein
MVEPVDLVGYSSDPAFAVDGRQRVLAVNEAAVELLGHSVDEAIGLSCDQLLKAVQPDGGPLCCSQCEAIVGLSHCRPYANAKCFVQRKDGSRVSVTVKTITMPGDPADLNRPVALILMSRTDPVSAVAVASDPRLHIHSRDGLRFRFGAAVAAEQWPRKQAINS